MRRLALIGVMLALAGCFTVSYQTKLPGSGEYKEDRGDFFLWGLVGDTTVDLTAMCPGGVARWRSRQTFVDSLIGLVTIGIYIPRHVEVECADGTAWNVTVDGDGRLGSAIDAAPHGG